MGAEPFCIFSDKFTFYTSEDDITDEVDEVGMKAESCSCTNSAKRRILERTLAHELFLFLWENYFCSYIKKSSVKIFTCSNIVSLRWVTA